MKILGISSGHDAGAAIIDHGRIVCAINEERLNRIKNFWGPPLQAITACFAVSGYQPGDIDRVAIANITAGGGIQQNFSAGTWKKRIVDVLSYTGIIDTWLIRAVYRKIFSWLRQEPEVAKLLQAIGARAPWQYIDHHTAHAASAYYTSPYQLSDRVLVVTTDGSGDGFSATVSTVDGSGHMQRQAATSFFHSPGTIYGYVTHNLGFKYLSHEGKIAGLAAYGNPEKTLLLFRQLMTVDLKRLEFRSRLGCWGRPAARKLHLLCQAMKREDIAAGVQRRVEEVCCELIGEAARRFDCNKLALAGGLYANVRLNQKLAQLPGIKAVFVHPHMGDGGEAVGAALAVWSAGKQRAGQPAAPVRLRHAYLGPAFRDQAIEKALQEAELSYQKFADIEKQIAGCLAQGKIVARFDGKMEYGPRALGNRSILYQATDKSVNDWLNKQLRRSEFMPFAPILLAARAAAYLKDFDKTSPVPAEFMTITYDVTDRCIKEAPAIVHVDGTARPQIVYPEVNPSIAKILAEYERSTGKAVLVNTSFNMHEEPIVCTPQDAIRAFVQGHLDILAIGEYIVENLKFKNQNEK